jgi:hypothetical protein
MRFPFFQFSSIWVLFANVELSRKMLAATKRSSLFWNRVGDGETTWTRPQEADDDDRQQQLHQLTSSTLYASGSDPFVNPAETFLENLQVSMVYKTFLLPRTGKEDK